MRETASAYYCSRRGDGSTCRGTGWGRAVIAASAASLFSLPAAAFTFTMGEDVQGAWNTTVSVGTSWRTQGPDPKLIGSANAGEVPGATGADSSADDGNLNYKKGDRFSTVLKAVSDLELKYQNYGGLIRATAWHDFTLADHGVPHGNVPNGYVPGATLSDNGFYGANKFSNIKLLDLYGYGNFEMGGGNRLNLRLGRQVVNWGESLFIQGINSYGTVDVAAFRRPGAEVKEALLPYNQVFASLGFANGPTIEAFYQLKWERTSIDACGTFFSVADFGFDPSCNKLTFNVAGFPDSVSQGIPALFMQRGGDITPKDSGQYGLALRYRAESLDTDFGAYYTNFHSRIPYVGFNTPAGANPVVRVSYPGDIKILGVSASTLIGKWSVAGELHRTRNLPVQINGFDQVFGMLFGLGPMAPVAAATPAGGLIAGFDRLEKTQAQVNFIRVVNDVAGANNLNFVGEVAYIHTGNLPPLSQRRYGRAGNFGFSVTGTPVPCAAVNPNADGCGDEGFVTENSWGYRLLGELVYTGVIPGVTLSPRMFWSHDVDGNAPDGTFVKDRKTLGLALKAEYQKKYFGEISYTRFLDNAKFDNNRDHDFIAVSVGTSF